MATREEIINQAKTWLGKNEKDGSHKEIIDTYNKIKPLPNNHKMTYTAPWCATMIGAVAQKCKATDIIPCSASCNTMIDIAKKKGIWVEDDSYTPKTADIIMYDWQDDGKGDDKGKADHVGFVEKVTNKTITVIEGNKSNAVEKRSLKVNGKYIRGYICPKYDDTLPEPKPTEQKAEPKPTVKTKTFTVNVQSGHILRLRSQPNTKSSILAKMPRGTKVTSTEQKNGWAKISYNKLTGWASIDYLK